MIYESKDTRQNANKQKSKFFDCELNKNEFEPYRYVVKFYY